MTRIARPPTTPLFTLAALLATQLTAVSPLLTGCGAAIEPVHATLSPTEQVEPGQPAAPVEPVEPLPAPTPDTLRCASEALSQVFPIQVTRLDLLLGDEPRAWVTTGPQFFVHQQEWAADQGTPFEVRNLVIVDDGAGRLTIAGSGLDAVVERDGAFFTGRVKSNDGHAALTCWNDTEVFGSFWGGAPSALKASFDFNRGLCVDQDGAPALNKLPLPFVRETNFAQCADLRGARLNGEDLNYPTLWGWSLTGAMLDGAELFFADLESADLVGAQLGGFTFGYARVTGFVDATTTLPIAEGCAVVPGAWGGDQLECLR